MSDANSLLLLNPTANDNQTFNNILFFGYSGSGVSSFINTLATALQHPSRSGLIKNVSKSIPSTAQHKTRTTQNLTKLPISPYLNGLRLNIWESWGIDAEGRNEGNNYESLELDLLLKGFMPEKWPMPKDTKAVFQLLSQVKKPNPMNTIQAAVVFVPQGILTDLKGGDIARIKSVLAQIQDRGREPIVVVTKIDQLLMEREGDGIALESLGASRNIRKLTANLLGVSSENVHCMINYNSLKYGEFSKRVPAVDNEAISILRHALEHCKIFSATDPSMIAASKGSKVNLSQDKSSSSIQSKEATVKPNPVTISEERIAVQSDIDTKNTTAQNTIMTKSSSASGGGLALNALFSQVQQQMKDQSAVKFEVKKEVQQEIEIGTAPTEKDSEIYSTEDVLGKMSDFIPLNNDQLIPQQATVMVVDEIKEENTKMDHSTNTAILLSNLEQDGKGENKIVSENADIAHGFGPLASVDTSDIIDKEKESTKLINNDQKLENKPHLSEVVESPEKKSQNADSQHADSVDDVTPEEVNAEGGNDTTMIPKEEPILPLNDPIEVEILQHKIESQYSLVESAKEDDKVTFNSEQDKGQSRIELETAKIRNETTEDKNALLDDVDKAKLASGLYHLPDNLNQVLTEQKAELAATDKSNLVSADITMEEEKRQSDTVTFANLPKTFTLEKDVEKEVLMAEKVEPFSTNANNEQVTAASDEKPSAVVHIAGNDNSPDVHQGPKLIEKEDEKALTTLVTEKVIRVDNISKTAKALPDEQETVTDSKTLNSNIKTEYTSNGTDGNNVPVTENSTDGSKNNDEDSRGCNLPSTNADKVAEKETSLILPKDPDDVKLVDLILVKDLSSPFTPITQLPINPTADKANGKAEEHKEKIHDIDQHFGKPSNLNTFSVKPFFGTFAPSPIDDLGFDDCDMSELGDITDRRAEKDMQKERRRRASSIDKKEKNAMEAVIQKEEGLKNQPESNSKKRGSTTSLFFNRQTSETLSSKVKSIDKLADSTKTIAHERGTQKKSIDSSSAIETALAIQNSKRNSLDKSGTNANFTVASVEPDETASTKMFASEPRKASDKPRAFKEANAIQTELEVNKSSPKGTRNAGEKPSVKELPSGEVAGIGKAIGIVFDKTKSKESLVNKPEAKSKIFESASGTPSPVKNNLLNLDSLLTELSEASKPSPILENSKENFFGHETKRNSESQNTSQVLKAESGAPIEKLDSEQQNTKQVEICESTKQSTDIDLKKTPYTEAITEAIVVKESTSARLSPKKLDEAQVLTPISVQSVKIAKLTRKTSDVTSLTTPLSKKSVEALSVSNEELSAKVHKADSRTKLDLNSNDLPQNFNLRLSTLESNWAQATVNNEAVKKAFQITKDTLSSEITQIIEKVNDLKLSISNTTSYISQLKQDLPQISASLQKLNLNATGVEAKISSVDLRLNQLENALPEQISILESKLLQEKLSLDEKIITVQQTTEKCLQTHMSMNTQGENEREQQEVMRKRFESEIKALKAEVETVRHVSETLVEQVNKRDAGPSNTSDEIKKIRERQDSISKEMKDSYEEKSKDVRVQQETTAAALAALNNVNKILQSEIDMLKIDLEKSLTAAREASEAAKKAMQQAEIAEKKAASCHCTIL